MKKRLILTAIVFVVFAFVAAAFSAPPATDAVPRVTVEELKAMMLGGRDVLILDLRSSGAYNASKVKIKGAVRIEPAQFTDKTSGLPKWKKIITYCTWPDEASSARVALILMKNGFKDVSVLLGGFDAWVSSGGAVETK